MTEIQKLKASIKRKDKAIIRLKKELKDLRVILYQQETDINNNRANWDEAKRALSRFLFDGDSFEEAVAQIVRDRLGTREYRW